jgi:SWIM zinc finger
LQLTEDQILTLAPDEASKKSGKDLANPNKWVSKGANEQALWGEAQGSGSKPYQTQVDLGNIAFKCSCPSRKFPCKHGLGLMLFYARQSNLFADTTAPSWVTEWLSKRTEKEEKRAVKEDKPVDEAAQEKRQQARQNKVTDGITELRVWMKDIVRNGILNMPGKGYGYFESMAKRMVDAQSPGLANMIRNLGEINFFADGWQSLFMDQLAAIYLVTTGYNNIDQLEPGLQQDIKTWIGFTQNQDELKTQTGIADTWLVLSKQNVEVDNIVTERNWLYGTSSNRYALVLQFIVRGQGATLAFTPGMFVQAELVFYPAVNPLRAIVKRHIAGSKVNISTGFINWQQVGEMETFLSSTMPVRANRPFIIQQLKLVQYNNQWWLQDTTEKMMPLKKEQQNIIWAILSISAGAALDMVVIGKEDQYEPVGLWYENEYKILI